MNQDYSKTVDNPFWLCRGPFETIKACYSIKELKESLEKAPVDVITHHVTKDKNDFANWIEGVIGNKTLSKELRSLKASNKDALKNAIIKKLDVKVKSIKKKSKK